MRSTLLTVLQPLGGAIGAIIGLGVLTVATRQAQFTSIASFGAGAGVAALASVAVGGGTTLAYTTGTVERQRAVRVVRNTIVLPVILIATAVAVAVYSGIGRLDALGVFAGGLSTSANVSAELDSSYLRRRIKTGQLFVVDVLNRGVAFGAIILGVPFAHAMLAGAFSRALMLKVLTRSDPSREAGYRLGRSVFALAYEAKLTTLSILYSVSDRVGALAAPAAASIPIAGGFMAVLNAAQSGSGVLMSGVQATLAARSHLRARVRWADFLDVLFVLAGLTGAVIVIVARNPLIDFLGLGTASNPDEYWITVALLIPASIASRVMEFRFLAIGEALKAVIARAMATCVAVSAAIAAMATSEIAVLANGLLIAEGTALLTSIVLVGANYLRTMNGRDHA